MFKKMTVVFSLAMIISLALSGLASAKQSQPQWEVAFDPLDNGFKPIDWETFTGAALTGPMVVFRENLYLNVWSLDGAKLFRSADGENWQAVGEVGYGYDTVGCFELAVFHDKLYITVEGPTILRSADGVTFESVTEVWNGSPISYFGWFGEFLDTLYVTAMNTDGYTELYRTKTGDPGAWEKVTSMGENLKGWGGFTEYKGMFYNSVSYGSVDDGTYTWNIVRTPDGDTWETVVENGFQSILQDGETNYDGDIAVHQGRLFVSTGNYSSGGGHIFATNNGVDWELVMQGGFGDSNNIMLDGFITYQGNLFTWTENLVTGLEVWMSPAGKPGTWRQVNEDGFGEGVDNWQSHTDHFQAIFHGDLYIATWSFNWDVFVGKVWKLSAQSHSMAMAELFPANSVYLPVIQR